MHMPSIGSRVRFCPTQQSPLWAGEVAGHGEVVIGNEETEPVLLVRVDPIFQHRSSPFGLVVVDASMLIQ